MPRLVRHLTYLTCGAIVVVLTAVGGSTVALAQGTTPTTTTVTPSPSPGTTGPITYSVTVTDNTGDTGVPTGTVAVSDGAGGTCNASLSTPGSFSSSGSCDIDETPAASPYSITAVYSSDETFATSTGTSSETVGQATPTVAMTYPSPTTYGPLTYDVTVSGPEGAPDPTGSVTVTAVGSQATYSCDVPTLSSGSGSCVIDEPAQVGGPYNVTAAYSGDSNYVANGKAYSVYVNPAQPTVSVSTTDNPAGATSAGTASVSYEVTVTGTANDAVPTGGALVSDGAGRDCTVKSLNKTTGTGSCTIKEPAGTFGVSATYTGDGNYENGTSPAFAEVVDVNTATALAVAGSPAKPKGKVTLTATVKSAYKSAGTPTGSVDFYVGSTLEKTVALANGKAAYKYTVPAGHKKATVTVKAVYVPTSGSIWLGSNETGSFKVS